MRKFLKTTLLTTFSFIFIFNLVSFGETKNTLSKENIFLDTTTKIYIKGNRAPLMERKPIVYKETIYVPLRFISQNMGMDVDYDQNTRSVFITEPKKTDAQLEKEKEKVKDLAKEYAKVLVDDKEKELRKQIEKEIAEKESNYIKYEQLPVTFKNNKFSMKLTLVVSEDVDNHSQFYFEVINDSDTPYNVDFEHAKFNYSKNGIEKEATNEDIPYRYFSKNVLNSISPNFDTAKDGSIYITLDSFPEDLKYGILSFDIYKIGEESNKTHIVMPLNLKND